MQETDIEKDINKELAQRKRVIRYKRIIMLVLVLLILIPNILCLVLFSRVHDLNKRLEKVVSDNVYYADEMAILDQHVKELYQLISDVAISLDNGTDDNNSSQPSDTNAVHTSKDEQENDITPDYHEQYLDAVSDGRKLAYLTFDDGPGENTEAILNILDQYGIKASFFVLGDKDEKFDYLYKEIIDRGHTLGLHSFSHQYSDLYKGISGFEEDFWKEMDKVELLTGQRPVFYRFPGGSANIIADAAEYADFLKNENIIYVDWNVSSEDAEGKLLTVDEMMNNMTADIDKFREVIILLHDSDELTTTVELLPVLIQYLLDKDAVILPLIPDGTIIQHVEASTAAE